MRILPWRHPVLENPEQVAEQFDDKAQERDAASLGMWVFLLTEFLFFGVLFACYTIARVLYPDAFAAASSHNDLILGTLETTVLLTSSLTMALAVHSAQHNHRKLTSLYLLITIGFGIAFLGIHSVEYYKHYQEQLMPGINFTFADENTDQVELVFFLYYVMTGFHMLHVLIGVIELGVIAHLARRGVFSESYYAPVEMSGLYWHFVDIIWIYLFPLFYLVS